MRFLLAAFLLSIPAPAFAQDARADVAHVAFASPVRVPGATLEAGEYVFAPGRAVAGQLVIDVYAADCSSLIVSLFAVETPERRPADATFVHYPGTSPPYLRAWFHPGSAGYEFVYAPAEAAALFATSGVRVPSASFGMSMADRLGFIAVDHLDEAYRGRLDARDPVAPDRDLGPIDRLTLARLAIHAHVDDLPADARIRMRLLDRQLGDLLTSYRMGQDDMMARLRLVLATLGNLRPLAVHPTAAHVLERVRDQVTLFMRFLTGSES